MASDPPKVFISYSHDSPEHCDRVLDLAQQLRRDGVDAWVDQFEQSPGQGWPLWCVRQILDARYVLLICTEAYRKRFLGLEEFGKGRGVKWEAKVIQNILYYEEINTGFIPIIFHDLDSSFIPETVREASWYLIPVSIDDSQAYAELRQRLTEGDRFPSLGMPVRAEAYRHRDDISVPTVEVWKSSDRIENKLDELREGVRNLDRKTTEILAILKNSIPPASSPARPHNLPPWMSPDYFIGRGAELQELISGLSKSGKDAVAQPKIVYGGGGTGKSRLAIQAAWLLYLEEKCDMAFFVSADTPSALDTNLANLDGASLLNLYQAAEPPKELEIRKKKVIEALRATAGRWVLLLDNVDSKKARDAVKQLFSDLAGGRFLATTRREDWPSATVRKLQLNVFNRTEAVSCLRSRYWKSEATGEDLVGFEKLADQLGYLPLGLTLASSYMESRRITPGRFLEDWKEKHQTLLGFGDDTEANRSLLAAFKVSYDQLSPAAVVLCHQLAWLAPAPFPRKFVEDSEFLNKAAVSTDISDTLAQLQVLSLIELDDESLSVHGLVLDCARAVMSEETRRDSLSSALEWLSSTLPQTEYGPEGWRRWVGLSPHLDSMLEASKALQLEGQSLAMICWKYGSWHYVQARFNLAEPLLRRALKIDEQSFGQDDPKVSSDLNNLAQLLQATNRLQEAEPLMRRALKIEEQSFGQDDRKVAIRLNNLAGLLHATNRVAEAEPLYRRALAIFEKSLGSEDPFLAPCLSGLAVLYEAQGQYAEAEPLYRRALAILEKSLGPEHPNVATSLNNLASLLRDTNRFAEAEPLYRRALAIKEKVLGPEHPDVATSLNNLADLYHAQRQYAEAEPLYRRALAIREKSLGSEHPNVATSLNNLASLLRDTNRFTEAEPLYRRALMIFAQFGHRTGREHPRFRAAINNYARLLAATGLSADEIQARLRSAIEDKPDESA
jgi:tetratricopeptide (TPR) repeat protein